jgi:hypothetical protein
VRLEAKPDREGALRVEIHQQHPAPDFRQRSSQADRGGGLADAALLVAHGHNSGWTMREQWLWLGEDRKRTAGRADDAGTGFRCP